MERHGRIAMAGVLAAFAVIVLTGCTAEKEAAVKESGLQEEYDAEEKNSVKEEGAEEEPGRPAQDAESKDAQREEEGAEEGSGRPAQDAELEDAYQTLMEAAIEAIEADDAEALCELQESEEAKALGTSVRNGEHYVYFPDGEDSGQGIGYYTFEECSCRQWYYGSYEKGQREGKGKWYYVSGSTSDGSIYKEVYHGGWKDDVPNGKGRLAAASGDQVTANKKFRVKNGLFYGTYTIKDTLEDGTKVRGKYRLKKGKYVTIPDEELEAKRFVVPQEAHLAIAFLYDEAGKARSCSMIYAEDATCGVKHFY